jgi:hypothetical protein
MKIFTLSINLQKKIQQQFKTKFPQTKSEQGKVLRAKIKINIMLSRQRALYTLFERAPAANRRFLRENCSQNKNITKLGLE